jgi:cell division protein FtsI/penicillin-binding protein 2
VRPGRHRAGGNRGTGRPAFSFEPQHSIFRSRVTSRRWVALVATVVVLVVAVVGGAVAWQVHQTAQSRSRALLLKRVGSFLAAWQRSDWNAMPAQVSSPAPPQLAATYKQMTETLKVTKTTLTAGEITSKGSTGRAPFTAKLELKGLGEWSYTATLSLVKVKDDWKVEWSPASVHPSLKAGLVFGRSREWPVRADILDRKGDPLTFQGEVVTVGVQASRIQDRAAVTGALKQYLGIDPATVNALLDRPGVKPDWFLPVITLRRSTYEAVKPNLYPVPGIVFQTGQARIPLEEGFAQHVLGRVHEATADDLKALGEPYQAGDTVGSYGLERAFETKLAGTPSGTVRLLDARRKVVATLHVFTGTEPKSVKTTLDVGMQRAAQSALASIAQPAALVAIDSRSGDIRAVVSTPVDGAERALSGQYPPGSTFKVVTAGALLANGLRLDNPVDCPIEVNAGGKIFKNFEGESFGTIAFSQAFARSCNTAFIGLAATLDDISLDRMASTFGFNVEYSLPVTVSGGSFPQPADETERAAAAIGQARVLASPVHMATVAAAVASGEWRPPRLVSTDPKTGATPLTAGVQGPLKELMGLVVSEGTAAGQGLPAGVAGKTGTAEFGNQGKTHAWFIGFQGDLAFAVLVEGGGVGGQVAAPIAAAFLGALP